MVFLHLIADIVQAALDCVLCFKLFLLQKYWANQLVDGLVIPKVVKFLGPGQSHPASGLIRARGIPAGHRHFLDAVRQASV